MHLPNQMNQVNCCLSSLVIIILISGSISYIVFSILYLIYFYNDALECKNSHLWEYVLVSLLLSTVSIKVKSDEYENTTASITIIGVINLSISTWGGIELWKNCCTELRYSNLWNVGLASFVIQCFLVFICVVIPPILICYINIHEESLNKRMPEKIKQDLDQLTEKINLEV